MAEPQHTEHAKSVRAMCPTCGRFPNATTHLVVDGRIVAANFLCPVDHAWKSTWLQVAT
jgi:hypothetical protein